jgi:hypothetical protein
MAQILAPINVEVFAARPRGPLRQLLVFDVLVVILSFSILYFVVLCVAAIYLLICSIVSVIADLGRSCFCCLFFTVLSAAARTSGAQILFGCQASRANCRTHFRSCLGWI